MLTIRLYGDPLLRQKAEPVAEVTSDVRTLAREMLVAMYREKGVGLAAPQVGVMKRLIVVDPNPEEGAASPLVLVNPAILEACGETKDEEGCLSFPDIYADVRRAESIVVATTDLDGKERTFEADGWLARVIQHEIDHLNGVLFIDHLSPNERYLLRSQLRRLRQWARAGKTADSVRAIRERA